MSVSLNGTWPVLSSYDQDHLLRIALPLGGIGTGTVSLGGRGDLRDWEIVNRPAKGFLPGQGRAGLHYRGGSTFFALYAARDGGDPVAVALEGALDSSEYEGARGSAAANAGLPRFRDCSFHAAYPLGQVVLSDPDVPLDVRIEAFNPFIPGDSDFSGIPVAVLRFVLTNSGDRPVSASICGNLENFIGTDGSGGRPDNNVNEFRTAAGLSGVFMRSDGVSKHSERWGTIALAVMNGPTVTYRTSWDESYWGDALLDFWDDFADDGELADCAPGPNDAPVGSLAAKVPVPANDSVAVTFLLAWHFPNRQTWDLARCEDEDCSPEGDAPSNYIGNYYTTVYRDAWNVVERTVPLLPELERKTVGFVREFCKSDLPEVVKEAALFNLSTLRSQTCFRTTDGRFYGWEGCDDYEGCCMGSCTHVWNYEQATPYLFADLAQTMRDVEFNHATDADGLMSFRVILPLDRAQEWGIAAADGQMGCVMKAYRDWQLSGDDEFLKSMWPGVRRSLEFCWVEGGWDSDRDGVMEGCQHNTMDVEYYGPNPQMGTWYLGALRAAEEMARHLGEDEFAANCRSLFEGGSAWTDDNLFNGDYYEHHIQPQPDASRIAKGLRHGRMGALDLSDPDFQLGAGCLVDQLVGQYMAHICGLGYLLKPENVVKTLESIMKFNYRESLRGHFNHMRSYALNDEAAVLMATYPRGNRPKRPFPYANEVMTGFEYTAAVGMIYEGMTNEGLKVIESVRRRYDGRRRSPFDEAECGHQYARAMASWAAVPALSGFRYSGVDGLIEFAAGDGSWFWSNGSAWGTCRISSKESETEVELGVSGGSLEIRRFSLGGGDALEFDAPLVIGEGAASVFQMKRSA